jgi:DNA polymerase III subunit delta
MTFDKLFEELKSGTFRHFYFLTGEEPYFIDVITDFLAENVLNETEKAFNQHVIYGSDTDIANILTLARRYPLIASHQLIIVKEAQHLRSIDVLEYYLGAPMVSTILVFAYKYKKVDKRTKIAKIIAEKGVWFESEKIREDKVAAWIISHLSLSGYQIEPKAATLLVDFLGNDLSKICKELEKLILVLPAGSKQINVDLIEKNIGISKDYNNFELIKAIVSQNTLKANKIAGYFGSNPKNNPFVLTISSLFFYFTKLLLYHGLKDKSRENTAKELGINPYFVTEYQQASKTFTLSKVRNIISWLREYDLKSKGGSMASDADLLKELIYKIIH